MKYLLFCALYFILSEHTFATPIKCYKGIKVLKVPRHELEGRQEVREIVKILSESTMPNVSLFSKQMKLTQIAGTVPNVSPDSHLAVSFHGTEVKDIFNLDAKVWNLETNELLNQFRVNDAITSVSILSDGTRLVLNQKYSPTRYAPRIISRHNSGWTQQILDSTKEPIVDTALIFNNRLMGLLASGEITFWDLSNGKIDFMLAYFSGEGAKAGSLGVNKDGKKAVIALSTLHFYQLNLVSLYNGR